MRLNLIKQDIMLKKFFFLLFFIPTALFADEGMWVPIWMQSNQIEAMNRLGLAIPFSEIYSNQTPSIKDAVVKLDNGSCTGEFISSKGLILTNHHCGFDDIQAHSSTENNYIKDGFWAKTYSEELANPGKTATLLISTIDISNRFHEALNPSLTLDQRTSLIDSIKTNLIKSVADTSAYEPEIVSFYQDNRFLLFLSQTFKDIRLVAAPPESIGNFGGESDNWVWPRHTGDFSIFRVYCSPDGKPAEYAANNVPYTPKKFLKISVSGVQQNDFTMTIGYPGTTTRYAPSEQIQSIQNFENPIIAEVRGIKQNILKSLMDSNAEIRIQYAAKYDQSSNYWKYAIGQNKGLQNGKISSDRLTYQNTIFKNMNDSIVDIDEFISSYQTSKQLIIRTKQLEETLFSGCELPLFSINYLNQIISLNQISQTDSTYLSTKNKSIENIQTFFKDYNPEVDKTVMIAMLNYLITNNHPIIKQGLIPKHFKNNATKFCDYLFRKSLFTKKDWLINGLDNLSKKEIRKDSAFKFIAQILSFSSQLYETYDQLTDLQNNFNHHYQSTILNLDSLSNSYPDANSTLRISYGSVQPYHPADAIFFNYYTTSNGILEKENPAIKDYIVPEKLKNLLENSNYQSYSNSLNQLPLCFITTNDITGGNSGSPVINKDGNIVGIAFDGNWEAMTSDIAFNEEMQRCICVDIRYVLFVIDKIGEAQNILNELNIVKQPSYHGI